MDTFDSPTEIVGLASFILLLLLNAQTALLQAVTAQADEEPDEEFCPTGRDFDSASTNLEVATSATLHHFRLCNSLSGLQEDLGYWVKPRSTAWFSRFLLQEYDDNRWIQMFRMTKQSVLSLANLLAPIVRKKDTKYRLAIPVTVRTACTLFKLSHGASLLICSELFAVGRSTVSIMLRQVVHAINDALRREITWPSGEAATAIATAFEDICGLPGILGAVDSTHIGITKPRHGAADYFYFKSGGHSMHCQAVVDSSKRFLDLYVGMPGCTNDSRVLRRSTLFDLGQHQSLWDGNLFFSGFRPYLIGDGGYPLLTWLLTPHRHTSTLSPADRLFNCRLSKGRAAVENSFALLKQTFRELHGKTDLNVTFIPDVVMCCALLHNLLQKQSHEDIERLLHILGVQTPDPEEMYRPAETDVSDETGGDLPGFREAALKRRDLGILLSLHRVFPPA